MENELLRTRFPSAGSADAAENRPNIYVTGFGPFRAYTENPSQLVVEALVSDKARLEEALGVNLHTDILGVDYDTAKSTVRDRCQELNPILSVHVGVDGPAKTLKLEKQSKNGPYNEAINGNVPHVCIQEDDPKETIQSQLNMDLVCNAVNENTSINLRCSVSDNPGNYICGYLYYFSLKENKRRAAFVHVPIPLVSEIENTKATLEMAIREMYNQVI